MHAQLLALKIFTAAGVVEDRCKIVNAQLVQLAQCVKWDAAAAASSVHSVHLCHGAKLRQ